MTLPTDYNRAFPCGGFVSVVRTAKVEVQRTDVDVRSYRVKLLQLAAGGCCLSQHRDKQGPQNDGEATDGFHGSIVLLSGGIVTSGGWVRLASRHASADADAASAEAAAPFLQHANQAVTRFTHVSFGQAGCQVRISSTQRCEHGAMFSPAMVHGVAFQPSCTR